MSTKVKRSLFKTFLNTGTTGSPVWTLINTGVASAKVGYNPKTTEEIYIHQDTASFSVDSYAPNLPIEASITNAETAFEWLDAKRKVRATLSTAETEIVNVWLYKGAAAGIYLAEKQTVSIQFDDFGGDGGQPAKLNYTINFIGNPLVGTFDPVGLDFVEASLLARLTSITLTTGDVPLVPQFKSGRIWYKATTTDLTNIITAVSEDATGVITIDLNDGTPVVNEAAATWEDGENIVIITNTVGGTEIADYYLFVSATVP